MCRDLDAVRLGRQKSPRRHRHPSDELGSAFHWEDIPKDLVAQIAMGYVWIVEDSSTAKSARNRCRSSKKYRADEEQKVLKINIIRIPPSDFIRFAHPSHLSDRIFSSLRPCLLKSSLGQIVWYRNRYSLLIRGLN